MPTVALRLGLSPTICPAHPLLLRQVVLKCRPRRAKWQLYGSLPRSGPLLLHLPGKLLSHWRIISLLLARKLMRTGGWHCSNYAWPASWAFRWLHLLRPVLLQLRQLPLLSLRSMLTLRPGAQLPPLMLRNLQQRRICATSGVGSCHSCTANNFCCAGYACPGGMSSVPPVDSTTMNHGAAGARRWRRWRRQPGSH